MKLSDLYKPYPGGQTQVLDAHKQGKKRIIVACGTRWGKSMIVAAIVLKALMQAEKVKPIRIWIVAKSYNLTDKVFRRIVEWYFKIHPSQTASVKERPFPQLRTVDGSFVECRSAEDPDGLRGEELDLLIVDEAAILPRNIWELLQARLLSRAGKSICISTPFGQNWFWEEYLKAQEDKAGFNFPTNDNPEYRENTLWSSPDKIKRLEELKQELPSKVYQQDYEASFLPDAASVFPMIMQCVKEYQFPREPELGHHYIVGADLALAEDFTAFMVFDTNDNRHVHGEVMQKIPYPDQKTRLVAIARRYNNARIIIDNTNEKSFAQDLQREGLFIVTDFTFSGKSKKELVDKTTILTEQKQVIFAPDKDTNLPVVSQFQSFGYKYTDAGNIKYSAPEGLHDDVCIACMLAMWGLKSNPMPQDQLTKFLESQSHVKPKFQYD